AQQRALGHVAGEPHHQHRIEREVDLLHLRFVDLARQVVLGLIDLGAHVRERGLGVEAGLELEQHEAPALEGGRTHLLYVADRLELGLDRTQQQPLGILRADAALGKLYVDDGNPDVRLRLLRDRHVRDEGCAQQKEERRDGEARVTDGVVDEFRHHTTVLANSETRLRRPFVPAQAGTQGPQSATVDPRFRGGERSWGATLFAIRYSLFFVTLVFYCATAVSSGMPTASTVCPSRTKSCPCTITRLRSGRPVTHMKLCSSSMTPTATNSTVSLASTARRPRLPVEEKVSAERGTRVASTGNSGTTTSAVMPSGMLPSALGSSISTR